MAPTFPPLIIALVTLLLALLAQITTLFLWRGRRTGDEPRCVRCGYDLRGLPGESRRCTECGADLSAPNAVRKGIQRRHYGWAVVLELAVVGLAILAVKSGVGWARGVNWLPYEPLSWVLADAKPPVQSGEALHELLTRAAANKISDAQLPSVIAAIKAEQEGSGPWDDRWALLLEMLRSTGRLPDVEWARYADSIPQFRLELRPMIKVGDSPVMEIHCDINSRRGSLYEQGSWKLISMEINGRRLNTPPFYSGDFGVEQNSSHRGSSYGNPNEKMTAGEKQVTVVIDLTTIAGTSAATTKPADERHVSVMLHGTFMVGPPATLPAAEIAAGRTAMQSGFSAVAKATNNRNELTILSTSLPYRVNAQLKLRGPDGKTVKYRTPDSQAPDDFSEGFDAARNDLHRWEYTLPSSCPPVFDVVLLPAPDVKDRGMDSSPPWPEELVIHAVTLAPPATQKN